MTIQPTNPFHISRAYSVAQPNPVVRPPQAAPAEKASGTETSSPLTAISKSGHTPAMRRLLGAVVEGGIDFSGELPEPTGPVIAMYRHPADKNVAATGLHAGRMIDVQG